MRRLTLAATVIAVALLAAPRCHADRTFTGSNGLGLSAKVVFGVENNALKVTLSNTATQNVQSPGDVLSGVFFDFSSSPGLAGKDSLGASAKLGPTSTVANPTQSNTLVDNNVGGEWAFRSDLSYDSYFGTDAYYGLGASGLEIVGTDNSMFGAGNRFNNDNLTNWNNSKLGTTDWGLVNAGYVDYSGNGGVQNDAMIRDTIVFTLPILSPTTSIDLDSEEIFVKFQYGSNMSLPSFAGTEAPSTVPEPGTLGMLGLAVVPLVRRRLRRRSA